MKKTFKNYSSLFWILVSYIFVSPVWIWNIQHDWVSFRFQFLDRWERSAWNLKTPLQFLAFSFPLLLAMSYKSLQSKIHLNWTLPGYLSILPLAGYGVSLLFHPFLRNIDWSFRRKIGKITGMGLIFINVGFLLFLLFVQPYTNWVDIFGPWRQLAQIVEEYEDKLEIETGKEPLIVAGGKYRLASILAFYRRPLEIDINTAYFTTSQWILGGEGLGYPYWHSIHEWEGNDVIYVDDGDEEIVNKLQPFFQSVQLVEDRRLHSLSKKHYRLVIGRSFRYLQKNIETKNIL